MNELMTPEQEETWLALKQIPFKDVVEKIIKHPSNTFDETLNAWLAQYGWTPVTFAEQLGTQGTMLQATETHYPGWTRIFGKTWLPEEITLYKKEFKYGK